MRLNLNFKTKLFSLFLILFVGFCLRFYQLGETPNSLNWDEVSWGYNAYSILQTGKDEYGRFLPTSFEALGDYKQPLYIYSEIIPIKIFGLNAFSVRFPSAFLGGLSIIFIYLLTKQLLLRSKIQRVEHIALLSAFFFAISPWSIQFSRVAYEANVALFFILSGLWIFLKGIDDKSNKWLLIGTALLSLSTYTYHSSKIFVPLLFAFLLAYYYVFEKFKKKILMILLLVFVVLNLVWVLDMRTTQRGRSVLITSSLSVMETPAKQGLYDLENKDPLGSLFHKRKFTYLNQYFNNYLAHFNPVWLFVDGDNPRHHAPGFGLLYLIDLPFILLGIFVLLKNFQKKFLIIFAWFLMSPIASALAVEAPNASRSLVMLSPWLIFSSVGWIYFFQNIKSSKLNYLIFATPVLILIFYFSFFLHQYFVHTNPQVQKPWQYGYREAMEWSKENVPGDKKIYLSDNFEQPYIFYLFYSKFDPSKYISQKNYIRKNSSCFSIGNYYFGSCKPSLGDIFIGLDEKNQENAKLLKQFNYSDGNPVVRIYEIY